MAEELLAQFAAEVHKQSLGEVRLDAATRKLYSTDASIYQIEPLGVAIPRHEDELEGLVSLAARLAVPIVARGSGTSLAGQTLGPAIIIDFTRHLNQLLELNREERAAWVQPGLVLNSLMAKAAPDGLMFGPDPASADRATLGGMLGNNSTGAHSISYGMTSDNALAIDVLFADGSQARMENVTLQEAISRGESETLEGALYREALLIREKKGDAVKASWPQTWRRASGYSINYLLPWSASSPPMWSRAEAGDQYPPVDPGSLNLAPMLVGSEGTLAIYKRIKIRLVPKPAYTVLGVVAFPGIAEACDETPRMLALEPSAIELIPQAMIRLARSVPAYARRLSFVHGDPAAIMIIEFSGDTLAEAEAKLDRLGPVMARAITPAEQEQVWSVRKVGLGLLMSRAGDAKPLPFIEDVAVPVEQLGEFVREFMAILEDNGTSGDFYAHASAGCLHVRPLLNLKTMRGVEQMRAITQAVMKVAKRLGGAMSGEHGDGLSHAEWLAETFDPQIIDAFNGLKRAADPKGLFNPSKLIPQPMHVNLRFGPEYRSDPWLPILNFDQQSDLGGAIEMCNGAGVCRKDGGVMCPSFQATREEMHSTRGRANLLRAMISTGVPANRAAEGAARAALDLCLECKGCKAECPSGVDMAKIKYDFLHNYYRIHRRPIRDYLFGYIGSLGRLAKPVAPLVNFALQSELGKAVGESTVGLSAKRGLPPFKWGSRLRSQDRQANCDVLFLRDPFSEVFYPELTRDALRVLEAAGFAPRVIPLVGAGRTFISKGFLPQAKAHAERMLRTIERIDPALRIPVVGIEPSEIYTLRDEYLDLLPTDERAKSLAKRTYLLDEFLLRGPDYGVTPLSRLQAAARQSSRRQVLMHGHCYQKAQPPADDGLPNGQQATATLLRELGYEVEVVNSGCCGMAGSFGYEAEHYELSMQIGELALFPAVRAVDDDCEVVAAGVSCRAQIASGTGRAAKHPISLIADRLAV